MRVLISAYACEPNLGSEQGVGWNWVCQAARFHEVWVLTRRCSRAVIEAELAERPLPNVHFVYHDLPRRTPFSRAGGRGEQLYYLAWQATALAVAKRLHARVHFDLGHHVTFVSARYPTFLAWLGIPFVWGPVGGGERAPTCFYPSFGAFGMLSQLARDLSNLFIRIDPFVRLTARRASRILTTTPATMGLLPRDVRHKASVMPAIGMDQMPATATRPDDGPFRILCVARLVYWKGLQLAVAAVARLAKRYPEVELTIVGSGGFRERLERQAERLGIADRLSFRVLPRAELLQLYGEQDVFLFPSLQDSGGVVVLEAMAAGTPVVCLDLGGPSVNVTDETGIRVPAHTPGQAVRDLAAGLERLAADPALRRRMGEAGRQRIAGHYGWDRLGPLIRDLYAEIASPATKEIEHEERVRVPVA